MPGPFDSLSPLEKALVETLQAMHHDVIKELRIFRWQTIMLVVFLIGVVALLKGVDPMRAAEVVPTVMQTPMPVLPIDRPEVAIEPPSPVLAAPAPVPVIP